MTTSNAAIVTRTLACGMPLVVERLSGVRSAALTWILPAGYAFEPDERLGLSAMWAELLLRGAGPRASREHADAVDRLGASRSASNGPLTLAISSVALGERLVEALPLLVDMVRAPRFDADAIGPARDLCLQAIESLRDDPQERAVLACRARHYPAPINRSSLGSAEGLGALTRDEIASEWRRLARPGGSYVAVAGAVDADQVAESLDGLLAGWSGSTAEPALRGSAPRGYGHEPDETNQVQIVVMHDAPADGLVGGREGDEALLEKVAVAVLSGGMSGRLFTEVREKRGLCYSVSAGYRGDKGYGSVIAYVGTTPERASESLKVLVSELERINTPAGRVTRDEFERAVVGMKSGLVMSGESTSARAGALAGDLRRLGCARSLGEMSRRIDAITLDQLNGYLASRRLGTLTVQTLGPRALNWPQ